MRKIFSVSLLIFGLQGANTTIAHALTVDHQTAIYSHAAKKAKSTPKRTTDFVASRAIAQVMPVHVNSVVGTAPSLPYRVWVTYNDGGQEFRQVRWTGDDEATERQEADARAYPIGKQYEVTGYIVGDNTTPQGYPVKAKVTVVAQQAPLALRPIAQPLPLSDVVLTGDNRLTSNRELAISEICSWDVTQQLYNYRDTYGLPTEGYTVSDGWDSPTTKLKGHGSGHYMSALALAYASATKPEQKQILARNIKRMVNELRECQERTFVYDKKLGRYREARDYAPEAELREMKGTWEAFDEHKKHYAEYGYGYLNAIPAAHPALIEMYRAYNNSDWVWAPYYTIHKQLAGLIDIATWFDDPEVKAKALLIAKDMGLWVWNRMHYRTFVDAKGSQDERRARPGNRYEMWNMYIAGEVGGIGESLARLSEMVSDPTEKARLLEASNCFDSPAFFDPLARNIDDIRTRHANQHIPMVIAALRSYLSNGQEKYYNIAENFWTLIQGRYRYATGGVGNGEMFRQPYTQMLSMATNGISEGDSHANPTLNETCCAYNLLKLTKDLNVFNPDDARYMDYYERTLYNQIVGSLNPYHYQTTYQYAVGLNATKPWGNETPHSTCCGGTGSENHVKYQEAAYFVSDDAMWVGLYLPSKANWRAKGVKLEQDCLWPAERSEIRVTEGAGRFALKLRVPYWATEGFRVLLNGKSVVEHGQPSSYVTIAERQWQQGDVVTVEMPFTKHIDFGPDKLPAMTTDDGQKLDEAWAGALMYGPLVMTATDAATWADATLQVDSRLSTVGVSTPSASQSGTDGNLYKLTQGGREFQPDYYRHDHSTHYFRLMESADPTKELKMMLSDKIAETETYASSHYTKSSYKVLAKQLDYSKKLLDSPQPDAASISAAAQRLDEAVVQLVANGLDKQALERLVGQASGYVGKDYTTLSFENLAKDLAAAKGALNNVKDQKAIDQLTRQLQKSMDALVLQASVDKEQLGKLIAMARERKAAQERWNALETKVPEYAPWGRHGYEKLMWMLEEAERVNTNADKNYSQTEVNDVVASLNSAINTMRPGNLAEIEELRPLSALLRRAGNVDDSTGSELRNAVEYGQMVTKYVADGSGTRDMITAAIDKLKKAMNM